MKETGGKALERHYTVKEVAEMWSMSPQSVKRLFDREPGVIAFTANNTHPGSREKWTLRIPQSVLERVHAGLQKRSRVA